MPQNDRLNLSFVKDNRTEGKKWPEMFVQQPFMSHFHFKSDYSFIITVKSPIFTEFYIHTISGPTITKTAHSV